MSREREVFDLLSSDDENDDNGSISDLGESRPVTAPSSPGVSASADMSNTRSWLPSFLSSQSSALRDDDADLDDADDASVLSAASSSTMNSYNSKQFKQIKRKKPNTDKNSMPINVINRQQIQTIAMIVEESLLTSEFVEGISKEFMDVAISSSQQAQVAAVPSSSSSSRNYYYQNQASTEVAKRYTYVSVTTPLPGLIHWIRCDNHRQLQLLLDTSNENQDDGMIVDEYGKFIPYLENITCLVLNNEDFCQKILPKTGQTDDDNNTFTILDEWMEKIVTKLKKQQPANMRVASRTHHPEYTPRLIFAMIDIDKAALKVQRKLNKDNIGISMQTRIDEALVHLSMEHDVEVFRCKKITELSEYLHSVTRVLENPVEKENLNAFDCVMKASKQKMPDGLTPNEQHKFELRQTWIAMLQMVPLLSKEKAIALVSHTEFSSLKRCYDLLTNPEEPEKKRMTLLQTSFGKTKGGAIRNEAKLSTHIYKMMTTKDPEALVQEE